MDLISDLGHKFLFKETFHAHTILKYAYPEEYKHLFELLSQLTITKAEIITPGGRKSPIAQKIDNSLYSKGWEERKFEVEIGIDGELQPAPSHKVDYFKNKVGVELEWNNKDPFFDRDLNNFRLLHAIQALSVGVIITRSTDLQQVFNDFKVGKKYGQSTTHWTKLLPKVAGGGAGTCPLLLVAITDKCIV